MLCNLRQGLIFLHIQSNYSFTICWQYYPFFTELPLHPGKIQLTICTHEPISRLYSIGLFVYICSNIIPSCYYSFPGVYREVDRCIQGFPGGSDCKESTCNAGDLGSIPGSGRSPGGGNGNPLQYSCLENHHGQRSLAGYSRWGRKESATTERLSTAL